MTAPAGRPLRLVSTGADGRFEVGAEALSVLRSVTGPLAVAAVCGRARQGKSYLLNQLARVAAGAAGGAPAAGAGFTVAATQKPCTKVRALARSPPPAAAPCAPRRRAHSRPAAGHLAVERAHPARGGGREQVRLRPARARCLFAASHARPAQVPPAAAGHGGRGRVRPDRRAPARAAREPRAPTPFQTQASTAPRSSRSPSSSPPSLSTTSWARSTRRRWSAWRW